MRAKEREFSFLKAKMNLEIPFFQRSYVWEESNWEELLDSLSDRQKTHFLGSVILKKETFLAGENPKYSIIDGQQRLTTLSILFKALYDTLPKEPNEEIDEEIINSNKQTYYEILFNSERKGRTMERDVKIKHSRLDEPFYKKAITEKLDPDSIKLNSEVKKGEEASHRILQCYKFFYQKLKESDNLNWDLWDYLTEEQNKIIIVIDLENEENEQVIFDTVNSSGVRLSSADMIKNALFQCAKEVSSNDEVVKLYNDTWFSTFESDVENNTFWATERKLGRITRDNVEILLHCIASIKGIYDPEKHTVSELANLYKQEIANYSQDEIFDFIEEINNYAKLYQRYFYTFDKTTNLSYEDPIARLFHILSICDVSTLHPYILKILKESNISLDEDAVISDDLSGKLHEVESYVIRHAICGVSTKNFNKVCALLVSGSTTIEKEFNTYNSALNDNAVRVHLKEINNNLANLILFWIELHRRNNDSNYSTKELKYNFTLEHIMPQKWEEYWKLDVVPVFDENGDEVTDAEAASLVRGRAIYEIGNMTLLKSKLNTSIRNYEFKRKIEGEGRKKGIKQYAELTVTKDIIEDVYDKGKAWNEACIRTRTETLADEVVSIWKL